MTEKAATTPPLGKILTADEIARFVARWTRNSPGPPRHGPTVIGEVRSAFRTWQRRRARFCPRQSRPTPPLIPGPARSDHLGSVPGRRRVGVRG